MELLDYGLSELEHNMEYILGCNPSTIYELTELTFTIAECDGSLTNDRQKAFDEIFKNYTLNEVFKILNENNLSMNDSATMLDEEKTHIYLCKHEFIEFIENNYRELIHSINNKENFILAIIVNLILDGLIDVNINDFPKLKKIEETYF